MKSRQLLKKLRKSARSNNARSRGYKRIHGVAPLSELNSLEDKRDREFLRQIGKKATAEALKENRAMGIPQTYWRDGHVIRVLPNGTENVLQVEGNTVRVSAKAGRKLGKGTVMHVKP